MGFFVFNKIKHKYLKILHNLPSAKWQTAKKIVISKNARSFALKDHWSIRLPCYVTT